MRVHGRLRGRVRVAIKGMSWNRLLPGEVETIVSEGSTRVFGGVRMLLITSSGYYDLFHGQACGLVGSHEAAAHEELGK